MNDNSKVAGNGVSILGVLGIVFVVLKLCKVIDWSWWWVTLPFWGPLAIGLAMLAVVFLLYIGAKAIEKVSGK